MDDQRREAAEYPPVRAPLPPPPPSRLAAQGFTGFAAFATWWLVGLIAIPYFDGNRLSVVHVVFATLGTPLCIFLWWVSVRMLRAARWLPPD